MTQKALKFKLGVVLALAFAVFAVPSILFLAQKAEAATPGVIQQLVWWFQNGIKLGDVNMQWTPTKTVDLGTDQVLVFNNNTGKDLIIDYGEIELVATPNGVRAASSTYNVILLATTTSSIPDTQDFAAIVATSRTLATGVWATSTAATTTTSHNSMTAGGQGVIYLPDGSNLMAYVNRTGKCINGSCETATSSNRGFVAKIRARYHFDD